MRAKNNPLDLLKLRDKDDIYTVLLLFIAWILVSGSLSALPLVLGAMIAYGTVLLIHGYFTRVVAKKIFTNFFAVLAFVVLLIKEVIISSYQVAYLAIHPDLPFESAIIEVKSNVEEEYKSITLVILGNSITLTPGTLTLDLDPVDKLLYIHCLDNIEAEDDDQLREKAFGNLERAIRRIFR